MARRARARKSSLTMPIVAVFVLTALVGSCTASCRQRIAPETVVEESPATTDSMEPDTTVDAPVAPETVAATETVSDVRLYILNTNTHKFHLPGCDAVTRINEKNRSEIQATRDEVLAMGYSPCSKCQ